MEHADHVTIVPYRDGPYLIRGPVEMRDQYGHPITLMRTPIALCRCGRSQTRPFCDGTHQLIGFRARSELEGPATSGTQATADPDVTPVTPVRRVRPSSPAQRAEPPATASRNGTGGRSARLTLVRLALSRALRVLDLIGQGRPSTRIYHAAAGARPLVKSALDLLEGQTEPPDVEHRS